MDQYDQIYKQQIEFYEKLKKSIENCVDLTDDPQNCVLTFANHLFSKPKNSLTENFSGIFTTEEMCTLDIFCMFLEIVLYGMDILTNKEKTIFDIEESIDDIVYTIKYYLRSCGMDMEFHEIIIEDDDPTLYRDSHDYTYEILPRPRFFDSTGWNLLSYRIIENENFQFEENLELTQYNAIFISKQKKIFTISFKYHINNLK